jgi:hypothetical protein
MSKTVSPARFIEWQGLDRISVIVHEMHCIFRELSKDDFGIDGEIEVVQEKSGSKGYETTGGIVKVQAKAGMSYVISDTPTSFASPVEKNDLQYWQACTFPVLYIVYHPQADKLYFREVKEYIQATPNVFQAPHRITFDKTRDEFSVSARSAVHGHARVSPPRITFNVQERLISNLLPVTKLPKFLYFAPTRRKDAQGIRREIDGFVPPFTVVDGRLYSLSNLFDENCVLRNWCGKQVRKMLTAEWLDDDRRLPDFIYLLNQLLGKHTGRCGLRYNPDFGRNYFPREDDQHKEFKRGWTSVRTGKAAKPRIVAKYYEYGNDKFWRHLAAELSFRHFGKSWFLQIAPKYFFTVDGVQPWDSELVGPYTTSQKAREHNPQVLNHVLFWAEVLSQGGDKIRMKLDDRTKLAVEKMPDCGIAACGIPDDPAEYEEPQEDDQPTLFADRPVVDEDGDDDDD